MPTGAGGRVYFGETLSNQSDTPVQILKIEGSGEGLGSVEFLVDLDGPALGQTLGGGVWPTDDPLGSESEVFARAQDPESAEITAGRDATLIALVDPASATKDAILNRTIVSYRTDGDEYQEDIDVRYRVHNGEAC